MNVLQHQIKSLSKRNQADLLVWLDEFLIEQFIQSERNQSGLMVREEASSSYTSYKQQEDDTAQPDVLKSIIEKILILSSKEKEELQDWLCDELNKDDGENYPDLLTLEQHEEIEKRIRDIENGTAKLITRDELNEVIKSKMDELRNKAVR